MTRIRLVSLTRNITQIWTWDGNVVKAYINGHGMIEYPESGSKLLWDILISLDEYDDIEIYYI